MKLVSSITLRRFVRDERGNIAVMAAVLMTTLMGFAALGVDVGKVFTDRRKAQGAVDLAAMAAVSDLTNADKAANATVKGNALPDGTTVATELGVYIADPTVPPGNRFKPAPATTANAARVTLQTASKLMFGKALIQKESFDIRTTAIATQAAFAEFAIGSRLLKVDGGLLNQALGAMLGSNLSLTAMDYQSLIDAKVDLFDFMNAVATRARLSGPTYDSMLKSNVQVASVLNAMLDTERNAYGAGSPVSRALGYVVQAYGNGTDKMNLSPLVDVGPYRTLPLGQKPKSGVSVSALDLLTAAAQIANGQHQIEVGLNLNIPGLAGATLKLAIGERPVNTSWVTVGSAGAQVHTAQTRVLLTVQVGGSGSIASVSVPVYVELASGTAVLSAVKCGLPNVNTSTVTLAVTPSIVDGWIGDVSSSQFGNFSSAPNPPAASLVNTPLIKVSGRAHATMSNMSAQMVTFSYADITKQITKTVTTRDFTGSLTSRLVGDLQLNVNVLGLGIGLPQVVTAQVAGILATATAPIDQLLSSVLATLGVGLGQADVWVPGLRCEGAVLVN